MNKSKTTHCRYSTKQNIPWWNIWTEGRGRHFSRFLWKTKTDVKVEWMLELNLRGVRKQSSQLVMMLSVSIKKNHLLTHSTHTGSNWINLCLQVVSAAEVNSWSNPKAIMIYFNPNACNGLKFWSWIKSPQRFEKIFWTIFQHAVAFIDEAANIPTDGSMFRWWTRTSGCQLVPHWCYVQFCVYRWPAVLFSCRRPSNETGREM